MKIEKDVLITITSTQKEAFEDVTEFELTTEGLYREKNGTVYLSYDESELMGNGSKIVLIIKDDTVKMKRFGENETTIVFKKGERYFTGYKTPLISFNIEVLTELVEINVGEDGGEIYIEYTLSMSGQKEFYHTLSIRY